jgi:hypothetical protein
MCTVIFYPDKDKRVFASLRDEDPRRSAALAPALQGRDQFTWLGPRDPEAGGTWLGAGSSGSVVILLNGGFEKHQRQSSYARSRGLIVRDLLNSEAVMVEWSLLNLDQIEPFTLVVWEEQQLYQLVWDGQVRHRLKLDPLEPRIWSSATLYDSVAQHRRKQIFRQWLETGPHISEEGMLDFFEQEKDAENGFLINRSEIVKTLSFTFMEWRPEKVTMRYRDFNEQRIHHQSLPIQAQPDCFSPDCAARIC